MPMDNTNSDVVVRINDVKAFVTGQLAAADGFLATLQQLSAMNAPFIGIAEAKFAPEPPEMPGDFEPSIGVSTIAGAISDLNAESDNIQDPALVRDLGVTLPTAADLQGISAPSAQDFQFTEEAYESALLEKLQGKMENDIDGGAGLAPAVEEAIWNRDAERRSLARNQAIDAAADAWAASGFDMPDGVLLDAVDEVIEKDRIDNITRSRDIMNKQAELAQQNVHHAIDAGISLEAQLIAHHDRVMDRSLQAARAVLDVGIAVMEAQLKRIGILVEIGKSELEARIAVEKFKLEQYLAAVQVFARKVDAALGKVKAYSELYQLEADTYKTKLVKAEVYAKLAISQNQMSLENTQANLWLFLEAAKQNLTTFIETARLKGSAAQGGAQIYAGAIASAMSSINAVIQLASSGETIASE